MTGRARITAILTAVLFASVGTSTSDATFPGYNGRIAYVGSSGSGEAIFTAQGNGTHRRRITHSSHYMYESLALSGNGRGLVFSRYCTAGPCSSADPRQHVWIGGIRGSGPRQLTFGDGDDYGPAFSRDGRRVVYQHVADRNGGLYVMRADGTARRRIGQGGEPKFSPGGRKIVTGGYRIGIRDADGRHFRYLTSRPPDYPATEGEPASPQYQDESPDFSPNGRWIVFVRVAAPMVCVASGDIYAVRTDGTHLHRVKHGKPCAFRQPVYSPDGTKIAYMKGDELRAMRPDGTDDRLMFRVSAAENLPFVWQPLPHRNVSLPWSLFRITHGGRKITVRYEIGCPDEFKRVRARERRRWVTVAVIAIRHRLPPGTACPAYLISAVASVRLHSPLGHRKLRHAHVTPGWPY